MRRYRRRLRTTNSVERLNEEIRRRELIIRIFPTRDSALRLMNGIFSMMPAATSPTPRRS